VKCNGGATGSITLNAVSTNPIVSYNWSPSSVSSSDIANNLVAGDYKVTVVDNLNCQDTITVSISEPKALRLDTTVQQVNCFGYKDGIIDVTAADGTAPYLYSINNGTLDVASVFDSLDIGTYTLVAQDANGCSASKTVVISQPDSLVVTAVVDTVYQVQGKDNYIEVTSSNSNATYSWNPSTTLDCSTCPKTKVNDIVSTLHTATAEITPYSKTCYGYASVFVLLPYKDVYTMPTAFSPNGDDNNDKYYPVLFGPDLQNAVQEFRVYDRWGKLLHNNPNEGWDGKVGGVEQPVETYTFFVKVALPDPNNPGKQREISKTGSFALMR
jgi:gliding motility-associated-like protein